MNPDVSQISLITGDISQSLYRLLLTEDELIELLRIPEVSRASDYHNVIDNLKRTHHLPCIHICKKQLYPLEAVRQWILDKAEMEQQKF